MKKIFVIIAVFAASSSFAQTLNWQKNIGGTNTEYANAVDTTTDGSMYAAGTIRSTVGEYLMQYFNPADNLSTDAWIVKYNKYGTLVWQKVFGGTGSDEFFDVKTTADGGVIAVGRSYSTDGNITDNKGGEDIIVAKYDANGNLQWNKNYGSSLLDGARTIIPMTDGSYVLNCYSNGNDKDFIGGKGLRDIWLIQISSTGTIIRKKGFGGSQSDDAFELVQYKPNQWIFVAQTGSINGDVIGNHGNNDVWVVKLDSAWNFIARKCFGGLSQEAGNAIVALPGAFMIAATASVNGGDVSGVKGGTDAWIIKTDTSLNAIWMKIYGGTQGDLANKIVLMQDGGILVGGQTSSVDGDITANAGLSDAWLLKIDSATNAIIWSKTYGDTKADYCKDLLIWGNNDFLFSGSFVAGATGPSPHNNLWIATTKQLPIAGPLPVTLISFTGKQNNETNILEWKTEQEINTKDYTIERSGDGNHFEIVKTVASKNSTHQVSYNCVDPFPLNGNNYYRLKMTDADGRFTYSSTIVIKNKIVIAFSISPVPAANVLNISFTEANAQGRLDIYDLAGKVVLSKKMTEGVVKEQVNINHLPAGNYFLKVTNSKGVFTKQFNKQ